MLFPIRFFVLRTFLFLQQLFVIFCLLKLFVCLHEADRLAAVLGSLLGIELPVLVHEVDFTVGHRALQQDLRGGLVFVFCGGSLFIRLVLLSGEILNHHSVE